MTLRGGPAAKRGHRYERWWTLAELVRMLRGETDSVRIEEPGLDGVEFVVKVNGHKEFHQAKRSYPSGRWSVAKLASSGVLKTIGERLIGNRHCFVFVSGSDARELGDLCEAACDAESVEEFTEQFLHAEKRYSPHSRLLKEWDCDANESWEVLRRVQVRTISDRELERTVRYGLSALFLRQNVLDRLGKIVDDATHSTLSRDALVDRLAKSGHKLRKLREPQHASQAIAEATDRYLEGARRSLIHGSLISRDATEQIIDRLTGDPPNDCVLTGRAGTGKTGCVTEVIERLRERRIQVLAFRLDRHMSATSTEDLGRRLELEESPSLVLAAAASAREAATVLIVDQLDAVSAMSGRNSAAFDVVERLLREAKNASIASLVVCREFDWLHDPRLRSLIRKDDQHLALGDLSAEEVHDALAKGGFDSTAFNAHQLKLLRLPQNLSLFLNGNFDPSNPPSFTVNGLLKHYWDEKRRRVGDRATGTNDQWLDVIGTVCDSMNETQQLSVRKERLDKFSPAYLDQYVSENVLAFDGDSYAFGHESFFDYCFARTFADKQDSLTFMLKSSEQHLFRRSQVRQILTYLRDADFNRYAKELAVLVSDEGIRTHIKSLVFALLQNVEDPSGAEWDVWMDCVAPHLDAIEKGTMNDNQLSERAWQYLWASRSWFHEFDERGVLHRWLKSDDQWTDLVTDYLRWQQRDCPDRVASLLEPYSKQGGKWPDRLRKVVLGGGLHWSRRFIDLFLKLMDHGTLDRASAGSAYNAWSVYTDLKSQHPDWIPEVLAHQMRRHIRRTQAMLTDDAVVAWQFDPIGGVGIVDEAIEKAAEYDPKTFVHNVLPAVLDLADAAVRVDQNLPLRDSVWPFLIEDGHSMADVCLHALVRALGELAGNGENVREWITALSDKKTHIANHLLLTIYRHGAEQYADEAVLAFCSHPWRFDCGYSDSAYWCATETLKEVVRLCNAANLAKLEDAILEYVDPYEKMKEGFRSRGWAAFNLLAAIPKKLRSDLATRRYREWERKFGLPSSPPRGMEAGFVGSPIPSEAAAKMSDGAWLKAIVTYSSEQAVRSRTDNWLKGGPMELAREFGKLAKEQPERFVGLGVRLPLETNPLYFSELLRALSETSITDEMKVCISERAFECAPVECGSAIANLLGTTDDALPDAALEMLTSLATKAQISSEEAWKTAAYDGQPYYGGEIETNGLNTTRGRAALALGRLILKDDTYIARLHSILEELVEVRSAAVSSCVVYALRAVAYHDMALGVELFLRMDFSEEQLLGTSHVRAFIRQNLREHFADLRALIVGMLRSPYSNVREAGARLGCLAHLSGQPAHDLADESCRGDLHLRLGSAEVAAANIGHPEHRQWCEGALEEFFEDSEIEVRKAAASCFRHISEDDLAAYEGLVEVFCSSAAYGDDAWPLLDALEKARARLPAMAILACEKMLDRSQSMGIGIWKAGELAFRLYQQHPDDQWTSRTLDLIDRLCLQAPDETDRGLADFER